MLALVAFKGRAVVGLVFVFGVVAIPGRGGVGAMIVCLCSLLLCFGGSSPCRNGFVVRGYLALASTSRKGQRGVASKPPRVLIC